MEKKIEFKLKEYFKSEEEFYSEVLEFKVDGKDKKHRLCRGKRYRGKKHRRKRGKFFMRRFKLKIKNLDLLLRNYSVRNVGSEVIANRNCDILLLKGRNPNRPSRKIWVEEVVGFVLKIEAYGSKGELEWGSEYEEIDFDPDFSKDKFIKRKGHKRGRFFGKEVSLAKAKKEADFDIIIPKSLPAGFEIEKVFILGEKNKVVFVKLFDGLMDIFLWEHRKGVDLYKIFREFFKKRRRRHWRGPHKKRYKHDWKKSDKKGRRWVRKGKRKKGRGWRGRHKKGRGYKRWKMKDMESVKAGKLLIKRRKFRKDTVLITTVGSTTVIFFSVDFFGKIPDEELIRSLTTL